MSGVHDKFKAYWNSIGKPQLEYTCGNGWGLIYKSEPGWIANDYRIAGDRHWELRRKWIDSDFTLSIERKKHDGTWFITREPFEYDYGEYREAVAGGAEKDPSGINAPQPQPVKNENPAVWSLVMRDMADRDITGMSRYGTRLQGNNGRDALVAAYQEALDLACYLRQAIFERDEK